MISPQCLEAARQANLGKKRVLKQEKSHWIEQ